MAKMLQGAIVYCPVCGAKIETATLWPGLVYTDPRTGWHFVSEWGEAPPADLAARAEVSYAPSADHFKVEPCGHDLTAEQAKAVSQERDRQLNN